VERLAAHGLPHPQVARQAVRVVCPHGQHVAQRDRVDEVDRGREGRQLVALEHAGQQRLDRATVFVGIEVQRAEGLAPARDEGMRLEVVGSQALARLLFGRPQQRAYGLNRRVIGHIRGGDDGDAGVGETLENLSSNTEAHEPSCLYYLEYCGSVGGTERPRQGAIALSPSPTV